MGNASSRQKFTTSFLDEPLARLRRTIIWKGFDRLAERIKRTVDFRQKAPSSTAQDLDPPAPLPEPVVPYSDVQQSPTPLPGLITTNPPDSKSPTPSCEHDATLHPDPESPISSARPRTPDPKDMESLDPSIQPSEPDPGDKVVKDITSAIQKAGPHKKATRIDVTTPEAEPRPVPSVRDIYVSRIKKIDDVYSRLAPGSKMPPRPKPNPGGPIDDDYDDQVAEYFSSSLMVALPQPQHSTHATGIAAQPLFYSRPETNVTQLNTSLRLTGTPADDPPASDEKPSESKAEAILVNYRKWDPKELFSKLLLDRSSIRLAEILPSSRSDDIHIRMNVQPLDQVAMQYEALSYVWGAQEPSKDIFVNKVRVPVGPNLHDALKSLRRPDSIKRMWIDGICVNQSNFAEKSREVTKMGRIYSLAKTVNVFLGASSSSLSSPIDSLFRFLNRDDTGQEAKRYTEEGLEGLHNICDKCQTNVHDVCKGFVEVCLQPWWSRVWILQEFYLAKEEPVWYWGKAHASNISLKRDFGLLMDMSWNLFTSQITNASDVMHLKTKIAKPIGNFKVDVDRISALISRRFVTHGFDTPRRMYRELIARASVEKDFVYGLRAMFDSAFGRVFMPDYSMSTELLFMCLAVFLVQFECWGDVIWWYPFRYAPGRGLYPSWLPDFTRRIVPHELDQQPLDQAACESPEPTPTLIVLNHLLHAEGYVLDKIYGHRHLDQSNHHNIFQELWQFDHCMNNNHECHEYFLKSVAPEDTWLNIFLEMYGSYYAKWTHFNSAFRGAIIQSTMKPEDGGKLPQQVAECVPCWDLLQWHALRIATPGLSEVLGEEINHTKPGCLEKIFSPRMEEVFWKVMADFFIGACIFDWDHISVWLKRFPQAKQWSEGKAEYWSQIRESLPDDIEKRKSAIADAYSGYEEDINPEVMGVSWCSSFYYTFLAYAILLDCDDHGTLAIMIQKLQIAGSELRSIYRSTQTSQIEDLASKVPSIAARYSHLKAVIELFAGRSLLWTDGGFRGISCPGVGTCCDKKSVVVIVDGLSFPLIVRDWDEGTGEGWLAGCANIRGVDMMGRDTEKAVLPEDYKRGARRVFKFR